MPSPAANRENHGFLNIRISNYNAETARLQGEYTEYNEYQRLCDAMYCGNDATATALWWYKSSDPDGQVRVVNGAYMRVLDHRGIFTRPAGENSYYKMSNDAPS